MIDRGSKTPVYKQIYEDITLRILQGVYPPGSMIPSESKLCSIYGVERATVRRALAMMVDDGKVVRIPGLGTCVGSFGSQAEQGKTKLMLFLLPRGQNNTDMIREPFNAQLMDAMEHECSSRGYDLLYKSFAEKDTAEDILRSCNPSGIFFASFLPVEIYQELHKKGIPSVLVNQSYSEYPSVALDNKSGAQMVMDYLLGLGHQEIGFIGTDTGGQIQADRFRGYTESLERKGIAVNPEWIATGDWTMASGKAAMRQLIDRGRLPTAIFAANDAMAIGAVMEALDSGYSVPGDISIVGFDNVDQATYIRPALTTVAVDYRTISRAAFMLMLDMIERSNSELNVNVYVPLNLVERESALRIQPSETNRLQFIS